MRAREIINENQTQLSDAAFQMMQKLRKGMAASLKAVTLAEIFTAIPGWSIQKTKFMKPSNGGWLCKELPGSDYHRSYASSEDGRIHYESRVNHESEGNEHYNLTYRPRDLQKQAVLVNTIFPALVELSKTKGKKINVVDPTIKQYNDSNYAVVDVSFEFIVQCGGFLITSPDGQSYEVYGDYKNGAIDPHTFEMFFAWAVENTNLMESILAVLQMEPHEKKVDYASTRYVPPPTASEETKRVYALLVEMTNDIRAEQKVRLVERLTNVCDRFEKIVAGGDARLIDEFRKMNPILNYAFNVRKNVNTREANWEEVIEKSAERSVTELQNMFVYKNTRKLASILTAKGNMNEPEILELNCNRGMIMGRIRCTFTDGSSFLVDNSIVDSSMPDSWGRYTYFYRFPTTFHNVVMPDGSKMGQPSEERMNEIFAKA